MANDFLPFASAGGANVMTQAAYAGLAARTAGFSAGTAQSIQLNKVWRQSSIMSAVLAQTISDITGADSLDDGTTAALIANLKKAIGMAGSGVPAGTFTNGKMTLTAANASGNFTADEVTVKNALGGTSFTLSSFNKTVNLAVVGLNGMDVGAAPVSGFVSLYAIYNPTTGVSGLLACNQTTSNGKIYTGANAPSGFTHSCLVSAWGTTAASLLAIGSQTERRINIPLTLINSSAVNQSNTAISVVSLLPTAAKTVDGLLQCGSSAASNVTMSLSGSANGVGARPLGASVPAGTVVQGGFVDMSIQVPGTVYYTANAAAGALSSVAYAQGYSI